MLTNDQAAEFLLYKADEAREAKLLKTERQLRGMAIASGLMIELAAVVDACEYWRDAAEKEGKANVVTIWATCAATLTGRSPS